MVSQAGKYKRSELFELYYMIKQKIPKKKEPEAGKDQNEAALATAQKTEAAPQATASADQVAEVVPNFPKISKLISDS